MSKYNDNQIDSDSIEEVREVLKYAIEDKSWHQAEDALELLTNSLGMTPTRTKRKIPREITWKNNMDLITISIIIVLAIAVGALGYACYNLLKKIEVYEEWVSEFRAEADGLYDKLKIVDDKNLFEKDDDVGFVFSEVVRIAKEFKEKVQ